ncbi:MAG: T9SS type A sorting domain-containing protein [Candidatus Zixiibacteriota bacterium]|nr:MAG: T9SS type A sorting domain-containing protein [candidate division Zixibacteria bacterium]
MAKRILFWSVLALLMLAVTSAYAGNKVAPIVDHKFITGFEPIPDMNYEPAMPGLRTDSPGEVIGTTQYDYQTNGSSGNRAGVDSQGGVHFVWMNGISYPSQRAVYFNYVDNAGNWLQPTQLSQVNGAGYCQGGVTSDDRCAASYHSANNPGQENYVIYAEDQFTGFGLFRYFDPPDMMAQRCYWPYFCIDRNDNIHVVSCENWPNAGDPQAIGYTVSTDGGSTWSVMISVDTLETISQNVVASPVSDKVAIVYSHPNDFETQWRNTIYYIQSDDGLTWDWRYGKVDVTGYGAPDSLYCYTDLAAIYDYNDNLNIVWNAQWVTDEGIYYRTFLLHYSNGTHVITQLRETPETWPAGCSYGIWNRPVCKMSLGVHQASGNIFTVYTAFDTLDCSAGGYANGDIHMQYTADGGLTWSAPQNLTNSPTPGCIAGNCDSDHWSALADKVDDNLHIIYVEDKDAGGIPQTEGQITTSPVKYLAVPTITGVHQTGSMPTTFELSQNYPNPFNAQTNIDFDLDQGSKVELCVYGITGAKVATLVDGALEAGHHSISWDASDVSSGVYYYKMRSNGEELTRKMTLLK